MLNPIKLLIVDDNPIDCILIRRLLANDRERRYEYYEAELGEQAQELALTLALDCMLLDYHLPDLDGLELLSMLPKGEDGLPTIPVIVLTGLGDESIAVRSLKAGATDYLVKGQITANRLIAAIQQALATHALRNEVTRQRHALEHSNAELARARDTLEQQVAERTQELERANSELAKAAKMKDEFLANMSHELRTPLNSIIGYNELLQGSFYGPLTEQQRDRLQIVHQSSYHLLALINDILDLASIVAGKLHIDRAPVDVPSLCESSLSTIAKAALEKQVALHRSFDPRVHTIDGDDRRLKQILVNLLLNAVKFTPAGGQVGLEVTAEPDQKSASFCVWDTGVGIAPTDQVHLFEPFTQLDSSTSRAYEGAGLGLALVARLIALHQGSISVESSLGQGSRFTVRLPWPLTLITAREAASP